MILRNIIRARYKQTAATFIILRNSTLEKFSHLDRSFKGILSDNYMLTF